MFVCFCACVSTFGLGGRAVRVPQRQQGHLDQLVEEQVSPDQHKLCMLLPLLPLGHSLSVLHHTENWQQAPWGDGQHRQSITRWHLDTSLANTD